MRSTRIILPALFLLGCSGEPVKTPKSEQKLPSGTYYSYRKHSDTVSFSTKRSETRLDSWFEIRWEISGDSIFKKDSRGLESVNSYSLIADTLRLKPRWEGSETTHRVLSFTKEQINLIRISPEETDIRSDIQLR